MHQEILWQGCLRTSSAGVITKGLITKVLNELKVMGVIPYFDFFSFGLFIIGLILSLITIIILRIRMRWKII